MTTPIRIEYMPLSELVKRYHPDNPKDHDAGAIITSMQTFGFTDPGALDEISGLFAEGHGRTMALVEMKRSSIDAPARVDVRDDDWYAPVIRGLEFDTPEKLKAYLIAANRLTELGGWDENKLIEILSTLQEGDDETLFEATGYDDEDLLEMIEAQESKPQTGASTPPETGFVYFKFGDYYGQVSSDLYDQFERQYKDKKAELGELALMDDVLREWLRVE